MRRGRLFWRIYGHSLFTLLAIALLIMAFVWLSGRKPPWLEKHERVADLLRSDVTADPPTLDRLQRRIEDLGHIAQIDLAVYRADGQRIAAYGQAPAALSATELSELTDFCHVDHRTHAMELTADTYLVGRWGGPHPAKKLIAFIAALLGLLALLAWPLARSVARPLERIAATARALGAGDLGARTGLPRKGETGQLAADLDEMAERIQALRKREQALLADVSHELRTPLSRMRIALEWAQEEGELPTPLEHTHQDLEELEALVANVLTTARLDPETGDLTLTPQTLSIADLLERAAQHFRRAWPERSLAVESADGTCLADADLMHRVLLNLLENAGRYSDDTIELRAEHAEAGWQISVADRGIGVPASDLAQIFKPFFRTDASRARQTGGSGLGLTLCQRIVHAHGGTIEAIQRAGGGLEVRLHLPDSLS